MVACVYVMQKVLGLFHRGIQTNSIIQSFRDCTTFYSLITTGAFLYQHLKLARTVNYRAFRVTSNFLVSYLIDISEITVHGS